MPRTTDRGPIRGTAVLVRRYLPTALAVAGVVALLDLTPTLDKAHGAPVREAPTPSPAVSAPSPSTAPTATTTKTTAPTSRTGASVPTTTVGTTTGTRPA